MYGRPTILFPLALLALLAFLTLWIDRTVQAPSLKHANNNRHDPDYILNNFVTSRTDINGSLHYMLAAVEMKHFADDDSTELVRPRFTQYSPDKPYTQVQAQRGLVSSDGQNVQFMDNVKVFRQASEDKGEMTVLTEYLNVTPDKDLATTDKPVTILQAPQTEIHAVGMIFDKKQQTVQLLKNVHVHYVKPDLPPPAATKNTTPPKAAAKNQSRLTPVDKTSLTQNPNKKPQTKTTARNSATSKTDAKSKAATNDTRIRRHYEQTH
ncbi:MAG TPA: LPS export ABC transporter periplasmic protein LptC [Methylophilaceae bacterium]|jgi:lipopolysaccharide export system protein LptC